METRRRLEESRNKSQEQYYANIEDVHHIQEILIHDILPSVKDEFELTSEAHAWARDWLSDTSSIFRISRRNKFTRSFTLEAIRKNLIWRLQNLWPPAPATQIPNFHCLPADIFDLFGRPILVIHVAPVDKDIEAQKQDIIQAFERLRLHLQVLHDRCIANDEPPPLQYVALLDLSQLSFQSINVDLFSWTLREVIPRFPGMLGGVFMLNYSWAYSGLWSIFKRLLPETALSRIFFSSNKELMEYFTPSSLPREYGGGLPSLSNLSDPLQPPPPVNESTQPLAPPPFVEEDLPSEQLPNLWLSATSRLNPFFGYPVAASSSRGSPSFRHGRRRKRDLVRTLALLFWIKWRSHIIISLLIFAAFFVGRIALVKKLRPAFKRFHYRAWFKYLWAP
ncbi:CRAL-TRIO domain-containing protein [Panaeolus papilionaceus]|nr:CRAL-TRIO domain-containing protein [Panaeolus papilionaceus]